MTTLTLVGRKEIVVSDAVSGISMDTSIPMSERVAALQRIHDDVDAKAEALETQIALESGEGAPEGGERHRYASKEE